MCKWINASQVIYKVKCVSTFSTRDSIFSVLLCQKQCDNFYTRLIDYLKMLILIYFITLCNCSELLNLFIRMSHRRPQAYIFIILCYKNISEYLHSNLIEKHSIFPINFFLSIFNHCCMYSPFQFIKLPQRNKSNRIARFHVVRHLIMLVC